MTRINHDLTVAKPNYTGDSIVNLMRSIGDFYGADASPYPPLLNSTARFQAADRIVLLVIDGMGAEVLRHIGGDTIFSYHQCAEISSVYPPTTASAITTFMTGLAPQQHGLTGWFMHFRQIGAVTAVLPFAPRFGPGLLSDSGVEMDSLLGGTNFFDTLGCQSTALLPRAICYSDFSSFFGGCARRVPYASLDDFVQKLEQNCFGDTGGQYVYAYWSELDRLSHIHGPSSPTVAAHLNEISEALLPIFEACADSGTLLVTTADHGFIDSGAEQRVDLNDHPELAEMLSLPLCGEPRSAYCYVRPKYTDHFERYVAGELGEFARLVPSEELIEEGWFGVGEVHSELSSRIGDYTLQMRDRYTIVDSLPGERRFNMNGVHGGTAAAELYVPLILSGP